MTNNKKILIICQHFWPEQFKINDIADFLVDKDCEIDVLCGIPNYPKGQFFDGYGIFKNRHETHNNIDIRRTFEIKRGNNSNIRIFLNYISYPISSLFHIPRLLTKKYDKILIYQLSPVMMSIAGIMIGKIKHTEVIMMVMDLWPENLFSVINIQNRFFRKLATKVSHWHYRQVGKVVVLSEKMKKQIIKTTKTNDPRVIVLPQVCEKIYETDVHDKILATRFKNGFNIVFTGNISPAQSFETIIGAAKSLLANNIHDINWIIVGDGMSRKWLESEIEKYGLTKYFYFEGQKPVSDMPRYTGIADTLIGCLVKSEMLEATVPAKVYSYIASGRPIVLAMDGEVQTLVNDTIKCGFAGPAGDANALYKNIKKMYSLNRSDRDKMGINARKYHFDNLERNLILGQLYDFIFDVDKV